MYTSEEREITKNKINEAIKASFSGWDFSYTSKFGGKPEFPVPWNYRRSILELIETSKSMLDMGTGGGEFLSSLSPLPQKIYATESYKPNIQIAKNRLSPLGIEVVEMEEGTQENHQLPFDNVFFDFIINRHEDYDSKELYRILKPSGYFITQQVGCRDLERLRTIFGSLIEDDEIFEWNFKNAGTFLRKAGFEIIEEKESIAYSRFYDIRTVVYFLKIIEWSFPDFSVKKDFSRLENVDILIRKDGYFEDICHRFFIIAKKPDDRAL
ncbi:MAG: class I SAM-dependent methyltransferase [Actinomycetia bacterium]|nr:class I SAM-dependent methyltransferase [Actinomycetes bacterium]